MSGKTRLIMRQIRSVLGPIFHVCFLSHHLYVFFHAHQVNKAVEMRELTDTDQRILDIKNFSAIFFTNWNLIIQTMYFALTVFYDILNTFSFYPTLKDSIDQWKGFLFTSFVFPCSIFVSAMFWSVYSINREWVLPEVCDEYIPGWLNHSIHTLIVVFLIIEVLITNQLMPSFKTAFLALTILTVVYDTIFFMTYFVYGRFIYGLFHIFSWPERVIFLLSNYLFTVVVMKIGIVIENFKYSFSRTRVKKPKT